VVVTDGGEPAQDTIAFTDSTSFDPVSVEHGNIQVHALNQCEAPPLCPEECACPETRECEPCGPVSLGHGEIRLDDPSRCEVPPPCPAECCPELPECEPCAPQEPPPPPPPPYIPL
jgi:hypothetical protein